LELEQVSSIDISIDGADEFTHDLNLIKGGGGALFREKIVASMSKKTIIITDRSKLVDQLGAFKVPIEVNPNAAAYVELQLVKLGGKPIKRVTDGKIFITDNHNYIFDTDFGLIENPQELDVKLNQIVGVVAHGIFVNITDVVLMAEGSCASEMLRGAQHDVLCYSGRFGYNSTVSPIRSRRRFLPAALASAWAAAWSMTRGGKVS
ncbi:MAG: ribose 5-phosphate isomerase A, partial [Hymenobacter sp.]